MNNKGSLALAMLLILVFTVLDAAILVSSANETWVAQRMTNSTSSLWASEAGLQQALWQFNNNSCHGMVQSGTNTACTSCSVCGGGNKTYAGTLAGYGDYDVTLNNASTTLQSIGSIPSRTASKLIQRRIQATIGSPQAFGNGIFAKGQVTLDNNALVNSFNSNNGPYGGANILSNGNVGSNGTSVGIVTIDNNATVDGNVGTGAGGTVTLGNNAVVSGTISNNVSVALPAVVVPSSLTSLASGGTYSLGNNGSGTINAGYYKYNSLSLSNNATLTINGNVDLYLTAASSLSLANNVTITIANGASLKLYVDGVFSVSNNTTINMVSKLASQFQVYSTYSGANGVNVSNNGALYAAVYAPLTDVNLNNNTGFYGAAVGKTVTLANNGEVHYDQALATVANPFESAILSSWQEY
jgi:hypothetical protein